MPRGSLRVRGATRTKTNGSDAVRVDPVALVADPWRRSTVDTFAVEQVVERRVLSLYGFVVPGGVAPSSEVIDGHAGQRDRTRASTSATAPVATAGSLLRQSLTPKLGKLTQQPVMDSASCWTRVRACWIPPMRTWALG